MVDGTCSAEDCSDTRRNKTSPYCNAHYRRLLTNGRLDLKSIEERYEEKVDRSGGPDACHPWTGGRDKHGYGRFSREDWRGPHHGVHRWAYKRFVGPVSPEEVIRHTCDNPPCQNRRHWARGTQADNIQDMVARGRVARGEQKIRIAKLTEANVRVILASPTARGVDLAARFGVSQQTICDIRKGRKWGWLSP